MFSSTFDAVTVSPTFLQVQGSRENQLATKTSELAGLRFSIILTARWESEVERDLERKDELRVELDELRYQYSEKIDEIAMHFGVQSAMDAKEEVERTIAIPLDMDLHIEPREDGSYHI